MVDSLTFQRICCLFETTEQEVIVVKCLIQDAATRWERESGS